MPAQRRSKESQESKDYRRDEKQNRILLWQAKIDAYNDYTSQLKTYNKECKQRQVKLLKRIKFRLPVVILDIIRDFLPKTTVVFMESLKNAKIRLDYFRFTNDIGGIAMNYPPININLKPYWHMSPRCQILKALEGLPISILDRFVQSSIVVNCHELVREKHERDLYYYCSIFNLSYKFIFTPDVWIYTYRLSQLIMRLHRQIDRGDLVIVPITRRLIKAILYLRVNSVYTQLP